MRSLTSLHDSLTTYLGLAYGNAYLMQSLASSKDSLTTNLGLEDSVKK